MEDDLTKQLLEETGILVEQFRLDLIEMLKNDRQLKNDSRTLNSLVTIINETGRSVSIEGVDYIYYVIHGRAPGRFPPPLPDGTWLPYPVGKRIAEFGTKQKYAPVAAAFDALYNKLLEDVKQQSGKISLAYITKIGTIHTTK